MSCSLDRQKLDLENISIAEPLQNPGQHHQLYPTPVRGVRFCAELQQLDWYRLSPMHQNLKF